MYSNIPAELKALPNWVCWSYKDEGNEKPTKLPINAKTGKLASVSNPGTWSTFDEAVLASPYCSGIGFVLTSTCGYSVIDLDHTENPEIKARQIAISEAFNSYSEISPSGKGLHIWVRGTVPCGRRRSEVEIYSTGRYMSFTGNVYKNLPICNYHELLNSLWAEMGEEKTYSNEDKPETTSDYNILKYASEAVNGEKFIALYEGAWNLYYPSQSEADFALVDIIAFYTQNRTQITRIFRASALGKRDKAKRQQYIDYMLNRAFDRMPPEANLDSLRNNLEQQLSVKQQAAAVKPEPAHQEAVGGDNESQLRQERLVKAEPAQIEEFSNSCVFNFTPPPGLIGEIAKFIYAAAPRPVPEIAIAGAIGLMAGVCGRSYNISGTGLNQYILILAITGAGKESCATGIDKLITETSKTVPAINEFIGPGEIASPQALMKYMNKTSNCFMSLVGEFGMKFKQLCSDRASTNDIGLKRIFLDLYNKSGKSSILKPLIYSDKDKNTEPIKSPAFSMLGETTPETFYENLNQQLISDGLLPRFTIIEYHGKRPQLNENHLNVVPSQQLSNRFSSLCAYALQLNNGNNVIEVQIDPEALKLFKDFDKHCDNQINSASNDVTRQLWNRAHIKSLKLAALLAVGCNYINPVINVECANWALQLIVTDVNNLLARFENGDIGQNNVQNDQTVEIRKAFKKYATSSWDELQKCTGSTLITWKERIVPHAFISAFCRQRACFKNDKLGPINAIKTCITALLECGEIVELSPQQKKEKGITSGHAKAYMISGMKL